jgi:hypothetical protein
MATFPKLQTGAVAQYPSARNIEFQTAVSRFIDGTEQRFRTAKGPARRWDIRLSQVSGEEMAAIEEFFESAQGRFGNFTFVDPWDGTEYPNCSLDTDELTSTGASEWRWSARLIIRNNEI